MTSTRRPDGHPRPDRPVTAQPSRHRPASTAARTSPDTTDRTMRTVRTVEPDHFTAIPSDQTPPAPKGPRPVEKLLLTPEEAAEMLSVGRTTVYDLIRLRTLSSVKIGRLRRIPAHVLREYVEGLDEAS
jgi:excisionase family DNA binding protein